MSCVSHQWAKESYKYRILRYVKQCLQAIGEGTVPSFYTLAKKLWSFIPIHTGPCSFPTERDDCRSQIWGPCQGYLGVLYIFVYDISCLSWDSFKHLDHWCSSMPGTRPKIRRSTRWAANQRQRFVRSLDGQGRNRWRKRWLHLALSKSGGMYRFTPRYVVFWEKQLNEGGVKSGVFPIFWRS